jgi:hypothetical protein
VPIIGTASTPSHSLITGRGQLQQVLLLALDDVLARLLVGVTVHWAMRSTRSSALAQRPPARRAGRLGLLQQSLVARARVGQQSRRSDERSSDIPASIPSGIRAGRTGIVDEARREAQERVVELHLEEGTVILEEAQNSPHPDDHD